MIDFNLADGAIVHLYKRFYPKPEADSLFLNLLHGLAWSEEDIILFGKKVRVPRLMCWYGDPDARYTYSGVEHVPLPWPPTLLAIKQNVERQCLSQFNSVLANLYRDGKDSMGCHSDDEKELGRNPTIASINFGDSRLFKMHRKKGRQTLDIELEHGDLLVMAGTTQHLWTHSVPKTKATKSPRINLTFRRILSPDELSSNLKAKIPDGC